MLCVVGSSLGIESNSSVPAGVLQRRDRSRSCPSNEMKYSHEHPVGKPLEPMT
jgi:hypothetical protein